MYNVGDILWIISQEKPGVLPYRIIEEVTKKTLDGSTTQYVIELPGSSKSRLLKESDDVYTSVEAAKIELMSKAESAIDKMLGRGTELIGKWNAVTVQTSKNKDPDEDQTSLVSQQSDDTIGQETVTLPDGQKVKINFKGDIP